MALGLVISPPWIPPADQIAELNPPFIRSIVYKVSDIHLLARTGRPLLLTVNNECLEVRGDWSGWDDAMQRIAVLAKALGVFAVCVGNEFDLFWNGNRADVPPGFAGDLVRRAARWLHPVGVKVVATSVASGAWQEYLPLMSEACRTDRADPSTCQADWFDLHAYGQRPDGWGRPGWMFGDLRPALIRAYELAGNRPVIMSEYGVKLGDAGGPLAVADFLLAADSTIRALGDGVCPMASWFTYRDEVGAPSERGAAAFGLLSDQGARRPAWAAYRTVNSGGAMPDAYDVGAGLRAWMTERGDSPVANSTFLPLGRNPAQIECAYGKSGAEYRWSLVENRRLARLDPAATS